MIKDDEYNAERRMEVSRKLLEMSQALNKEAVDSDDYNLAVGASFIQVTSAIILQHRDCRKLSELIKMFSSSKIMDELMKTEEGKSFFGGLPTIDELLSMLDDDYDEDEEDYDDYDED